MIDGLDIPSLLLDPQNEDEVVQQAYEKIRSASDGRISDFNPSSPVSALIEGQTYVYMELLWYLNQLPEALALEVLRLSGVTRSPGTKATGIINFLLQAPLATDFTVSAGYLISYKDSGYQTMATLVIPAGATEASVPIQALREGSNLNAPSYAIANGSVGLSYVRTVYNPVEISGGSDLEPLPETLRRAQIALRSRDVLVTVEDYESKAQELLGFGSTATAYPLLSSNKQTEKMGNIHVFLSDSQGSAPNTQTCQTIQSQLKNLSFAGSSVWVSPYEYHQLDITATVKVNQISQDLANAVFSDLQDYFSPVSFQLGSTVAIREVEYRIRSVDGVTELVATLLDNQAVNVPMPNKYTQPTANSLTLSMVDPTGLSTTFYMGNI